MAEPPSTRPSLLVRLRDARDSAAWQQFVVLYAPVVYGYARKRGLQDADAADLTQEVLRAVARGTARLEYDPRRGTFRGWLFTVVRNKLHNFLARRKAPMPASGDSAMLQRLDEVPVPADDEERWNREYQQHVLARALELTRPCFREPSWLAFRQTAIEGKKACDVAKALRMSVAAVYMAKSRVLALVKEHVRRLEEADGQSA